jgi:copper(I)-binding protein
MKRLILFVALTGALVATWYLNSRNDSVVSLLDARATQVHGEPNTFVVTLTIQNNGDATELVGVESPSADSAMIVNSGYEGASIIIPAQSKGIMAADGTHIMLMISADLFNEGAFIPLTLTFEDYGVVTTRLLNAGSDMTEMNHSRSRGVSVTPSPKLSVSAPNGVSKSGFDIKLEVEDFSFVLAPNDAQHIPNEGHAHVYLNGLKLGRLYNSAFTLGAVPANEYELRVTLNSNDHRPYLTEGSAVQEVLSFKFKE